MSNEEQQSAAVIEVESDEEASTQRDSNSKGNPVRIVLYTNP